jgi:hypothetical protein
MDSHSYASWLRPWLCADCHPRWYWGSAALVAGIGSLLWLVPWLVLR